MRLLKHRSVDFYLGFVLLLALTIGGSVMAYADSGPISATLVGGKLTESSAVQPVNLHLNGKAKEVTYSLPITVIDARGTGGGWNLKITSTRFVNTQDHHGKLPTNASRITQMNVSCAVNSTCTKPVNNHSYGTPFIIPAGDTPPPAAEFFDARVGSGLGAFLLTMMVQVSIPGQTTAGIYTSTIYLSVVAGP